MKQFKIMPFQRSYRIRAKRAAVRAAVRAAAVGRVAQAVRPPVQDGTTEWIMLKINQSMAQSNVKSSEPQPDNCEQSLN